MTEPKKIEWSAGEWYNLDLEEEDIDPSCDPTPRMMRVTKVDQVKKTVTFEAIPEDLDD